MKRVVFALMALMLVHLAFADRVETANDSTRHRRNIGYYFNFGMGAMIGCSQCQSTGKVASLTTSFVQGIRIGNRWLLGAGIGFDSYENWKTMPLFGSISWDVIGKRNKVFVSMNYGYSAAWINNGSKGYGYKSDTGGEMINPSIGYRIKAGSASVSFGIGYKFQRVVSKYEYPYNFWMLPSPPPPASTSENRIDMNRMVISMSIGWR